MLTRQGRRERGRGVRDNWLETQFSEYGKMRKAKLDVLQDGNPYVITTK